MKRYSSDKLAKFKANIIAKRDKFQEELDYLQSRTSGKSAHSEESGIDLGDMSSRQQTQEMNNRLTNKFQTQVNELTSALTRIELGTYGVCEDSGELIDEKRLNAMPAARRSVEAKKILNKVRRRSK